MTLYICTKENVGGTECEGYSCGFCYSVEDCELKLERELSDFYVTKNIDKKEKTKTKELNEIYEALVVIRDTCSSQIGCIKCPIGDDSGRCLIHDRYPADWKLKNPDEVVRLME